MKAYNPDSWLSVGRGMNMLALGKRLFIMKESVFHNASDLRIGPITYRYHWIQQAKRIAEIEQDIALGRQAARGQALLSHLGVQIQQERFAEEDERRFSDWDSIKHLDFAQETLVLSQQEEDEAWTLIELELSREFDSRFNDEHDWCVEEPDVYETLLLQIEGWLMYGSTYGYMRRRK